MDQAGVHKEFSKFVVVGIISTIINYGTFYILYSLLPHQYLLDSALGYCTGLVVGYFLNRHWTFTHKKSPNQRREFARYITVYAASLALSLLFLSFLKNVLHLNPLLGNFFSIGLSTVTNFVGLKLVVFTTHRPTPPQP